MTTGQTSSGMANATMSILLLIIFQVLTASDSSFTIQIMICRVCRISDVPCMADLHPYVVSHLLMCLAVCTPGMWYPPEKKVRSYLSDVGLHLSPENTIEGAAVPGYRCMMSVMILHTANIVKRHSMIKSVCSLLTFDCMVPKFWSHGRNSGKCHAQVTGIVDSRHSIAKFGPRARALEGDLQSLHAESRRAWKSAQAQ